MKEEKQKQKEVKEIRSLQTRAELIQFAFEVGSAIAVPLVICAFIGRFVDKTYNTTPLFFIAGLILSLISTTIIIYKKVKHFL